MKRAGINYTKREHKHPFTIVPISPKTHLTSCRRPFGKTLSMQWNMHVYFNFLNACNTRV